MATSQRRSPLHQALHELAGRTRLSSPVLRVYILRELACGVSDRELLGEHIEKRMVHAQVIGGHVAQGVPQALQLLP